MKNIAYTLVLLALCSCNSDVFIDEFLPSVTELSLDGNGDSAIIYFSNSNWNWLYIYVYTTDFSIEMYDVDGNLQDGSSRTLTGLGKMVCGNDSVSFTIERTTLKEVEITVYENMLSSSFSFQLIAGNEYESKYIDVAISPFDGYAFDTVSYLSDVLSYNDQQLEARLGSVQENNSDLLATWKPHPYKKECRKICTTKDNALAFQLWRNGLPTIGIPSYGSSGFVMGGELALYVSNAATRKLCTFIGTFLSQTPKEYYLESEDADE